MRKMIVVSLTFIVSACSSSGTTAKNDNSDADTDAASDTGTEKPCGVDADCDDGFNCTIDSCASGKCRHTIGPESGTTVCPNGSYCIVGAGCIPLMTSMICSTICSYTSDKSWDTPPCDTCESECAFCAKVLGQPPCSPYVYTNRSCTDHGAGINPEFDSTTYPECKWTCMRR